VGLVVIAGAASAQPGAVSLYADAGFTSCDVAEPAGLLTVYVVHEWHPGASAVQYRLLENTGGSLSYLADQNSFTMVIGDSQSGIAVSYGGCVQGQIHVQNVLYSVLSSPAVCTGVEPGPDPGAPSGQIESVNCSLVKEFPNRHPMTFNGDGSCPCGIVHPAETSTWGRVKSLYGADG